MTQPVHPTVFSALHDILHTLRSTYPAATSAHLHPYATRSSERDAGPEDASSSTLPALSSARLDKARLLRGVQGVRHALGQFRATWDGERGRIANAEPAGEDPAVLAERRKAMLLRVMVDWCNQQSAYAPLQLHLATLLALSPRAPATPFVHRFTTASPTQRLVALGQALFQDAPEVNDGDPDYGMRSGEDVQVDSITFGGKRLVLEIQIRHPQPRVAGEGESRIKTRTGWHLVEVKFSYDATGAGEDVHLTSADAVLARSLGAYLAVLDRIAAVGHEGVDDDADAPGETLALQAERAIGTFEGDLRALVVLDDRMGAGGEGGAAVPVDWFAEVERVKWVVRTAAEDGTHGIHVPLHPSIMPTFHLLDPSSFPPSRNPAITLRPSPSAQAITDGQNLENLHGWQIDLPRAMVLPITALSPGSYKPRRAGPGAALEDLLLRGFRGLSDTSDLASTSWERPALPDALLLRVQCFPSGTPGYVVQSLAVSAPVRERLFKLYQQVLLQPLFLSCFKGAAVIPLAARQDTFDMDLDELLSDHTSGPVQVTVRLGQDSLKLGLVLPIATQHVRRPASLGIDIRAKEPGGAPAIAYHLESLGGPQDIELDPSISGRLKDYLTWQRLQERKGDIPSWLCRAIQGLQEELQTPLKREQASEGMANDGRGIKKPRLVDA